tara:strand:+ start:32 stop:1279 length:1248 start_codon:yes stop_codon:yes gene_type:complete
MPIGFANSILAQGTTSTTNSFLGWDGSNDHTFTRNAAVNHFIGFAPFNDEYGVMVSALDGGGSSADKIIYDVMRNNSGTMSITSQGNIIINDVGTSNYQASSKYGLVAPLQNGKVLYDPKDANDNNYHIFSISGATVSHTTGAQAISTEHSTPIFVSRTSDSTGYNNIRTQKLGETIETSGHHFEQTPTVSTESSSNTTLFYGSLHGVPGFVDNDTPFFLNDRFGNGEKLEPYKIDLSTAGAQAGILFSGSPTNSQTMTQFDTANSTNFGSNSYELDLFATPPYNDVAFNDVAIFIRREGGGSSNKFVFDTYKAGDSSVERSNILTVSNFSTGGDTSGTCCFVGATNDVFLFAGYDPGNTRIIVVKYVHSTNTLSEVLDFSENLGSSNEEVRLHRWGSSGAILTYGTTKMRLIQA